jgi:hypothetical protein
MVNSEISCGFDIITDGHMVFMHKYKSKDNSTYKYMIESDIFRIEHWMTDKVFKEYNTYHITDNRYDPISLDNMRLLNEVNGKYLVGADVNYL